MIVYYITSHGFGHAVRSCEVIRNLDPSLPLTLRTKLPEWFLRNELGGRPYTLAPAAFDCGVLGPDSVHVDLEATITRMETLLEANQARLADEVAFLKRVGARAVVTDVPPFPLRAAREAGVPSALVANFTWVGIYEHLVDQIRPEPPLALRARAVIAAMQRDYEAGEVLLATDMTIPMRACRRRLEMPMVARRGRPRREELAASLGLDPARPIALLYLGRDGMDGIDWPRLGELPIQVIGYAPPPGSAPYVRPIPEDALEHVDAAASVDVVIAKSGYGICGECITAGVPLIFPPRPEFAEMSAVYKLMDRWGGGVSIGDEEFRALNWAPYLAEAFSRDRRFNPIDCSGGPACARAIEDLWNSGAF